MQRVLLQDISKILYIFYSITSRMFKKKEKNTKLFLITDILITEN